LAKTIKKKMTSFRCNFVLAFGGLAYMVSQGNMTATIVWFAITTGAIAGLSYYSEKS
jgi:hypothetical protein